MVAEDLQSLHETLFWLSQPGVREDIAEARSDQENGRTTSGKPLRGDLEGLRSARRGDYRVLRIDESASTVLIIRIAHRSVGYRTL